MCVYKNATDIETERAAPNDATRLGETIDRRVTLRDYASNALAVINAHWEDSL